MKKKTLLSTHSTVLSSIAYTCLEAHKVYLPSHAKGKIGRFTQKSTTSSASKEVITRRKISKRTVELW